MQFVYLSAQAYIVFAAYRKQSETSKQCGTFGNMEKNKTKNIKEFNNIMQNLVICAKTPTAKIYNLFQANYSLA